MDIQEKNWTYYFYKGKDYIITKILPILEIYELSNDFELELVKNKKSSQNYSFLNYRLHKNYKNLFLTPCQSLFQFNENLFIMFLKKRLVGDYYEYYVGCYNPKRFELKININLWDRGSKKYLNSFQKINSNFYCCFGLGDKNYKIEKLFKFFKRKPLFRQII